MSIEIIYGRQFIQTTRGIIPLFLSGSSNCTMFVGGREIRERRWSGLFFDTGVEIPETELLENIEHFRNVDEDAEKEICRINGKNVGGKEVYRYLINGVKYAKTIETIFALTHRRLECRVLYSVKTKDSYWGYSYPNEMLEYIDNTQALEDWIDKASARIEEIKATIPDASWCHMEMDFGTIKPLGIDKGTVDVKGPVIAKLHGWYVTEYAERTVSTNGDISQAVVFDSIDHAKSELPEFSGEHYQFVKASAIQKHALKKWVLMIEEGSRSGYFIKKLNSRSLAFCYKAIDAKRFASEDEAMAWFNTKISGRFSGCVSASVQRITDAT